MGGTAMANPEHVKILEQGVGAWNRWRKEYPGTKPDLSDVKLSGVQFSPNLNLAETDLSGADLSDAVLVMVDLAGAKLSRTDLSRADLSTASFTGAILSEALLFGAKLTDSDLSGANLSKAILSRANLTGANLAKATLLGANLFEANLWEANLEQVNLTGSNLSWTNLTEANLSGANFHQSQLSYTAFVNVDLRDVQGLETVKHVGPSYIAISTIFNCGGDIPTVFLRGCGIPETFIKHLPLLLSHPIQYSLCFISYSYADKAFALKLHDNLQARGIRCWLDEHHSRPRNDIVQRLDRGINKWDRVLLCCSKDSLTSWWIDKEIVRALGKERKLMKQSNKKAMALMPLNLDGYLLSDEYQGEMKQQLESRLAPDFTGWETDNAKFEEQFERVVKALRTDEAAREIPPECKL